MPTGWSSRPSPWGGHSLEHKAGNSYPAAFGDMRQLRTLEGVAVRGQRVLTRIDGNVAVDDDGRPVAGGQQRLEAVLPTLRDLHDRGARLILLLHLGRPGGKVVEHLRVDDVARRLSLLLGVPVQYVPEIRGPSVRAVVDRMADGDVVMLENLRFDPGEEAESDDFARDLAALGNVYVNEAFGASHRAHASVSLLPTLLPSYAGPLLAREVAVLSGVLERPARPAVAIVGGAKLETKLKLLENLLPRVDHFLPGGGIANTLLVVSGVYLDGGIVEHDPSAEIRSLFAAHRSKVVLPTDVRVARGGDTSRALVLPVSAVGGADLALDLGPDTTVAYCRILRSARTCVWNGPLGRFELPAFAEATRAVARCVRAAETFSVVGGGDTVRAFTEMDLLDHFDHVSTGGGAMLAFLEGAPMPGLEPLYDALH